MTPYIYVVKASLEWCYYSEKTTEHGGWGGSPYYFIVWCICYILPGILLSNIASGKVKKKEHVETNNEQMLLFISGEILRTHQKHFKKFLAFLYYTKTETTSQPF